ncbi:MAG TPA: hypothetical protein ACFYD6_06735 [Candidatus Brocadiia bacterium]|nr:hypothetical protein [Candidatus Brocadiales bacterium]
MKEDLEYLRKFPKDRNGLYIVYELYTFDNLFRLFLKNSFDHKEALYFILFNCSLSAFVFQERIHNKGYRKLSAKDALPPDLAACKAQLIYDLMSMNNMHKEHNQK